MYFRKFGIQGIKAFIGIQPLFVFDGERMLQCLEKSYSTTQNNKEYTRQLTFSQEWTATSSAFYWTNVSLSELNELNKRELEHDTETRACQIEKLACKAHWDYVTILRKNADLCRKLQIEPNL